MSMRVLEIKLALYMTLLHVYKAGEICSQGMKNTLETHFPHYQT